MSSRRTRARWGHAGTGRAWAVRSATTATWMTGTGARRRAGGGRCTPCCGSDGKSVHVEGWEKYKDIIAGLCFHCQQPLRKKEGVFSGRYCKVEGRGKCHKECLEQHKVSVGEVCDLCEGALLRPYVILRDGSGGLHVRPGQENLTIHKDCWHAFLRGGGDKTTQTHTHTHTHTLSLKLAHTRHPRYRS